MKLWEGFMNCAMARQMIRDAGGDDRAEISVWELANGSPAMKRLAGNWLTSFLHAVQLNRDGPRIENWTHLTGRLRETMVPGGKVLRLDLEDRVVDIPLDENSRLQQRLFLKGDQLHVWIPEGKTAARYVFSDRAYRTMTYYHEQPTVALMEQYLELSASEQELYAALASDEEVRRSALRAMAYAAGVAIHSNWNIRTELMTNIAADYQQKIRPAMGGVQLDAEWFPIMLWGLFGDIQSAGYRTLLQERDRTMDIFVLYGVLSGGSVWQLEGNPLTRILTDELPWRTVESLPDLMEGLVPAAWINSAISEVAQNAPEDPDNLGVLEKLMFRALCSYGALSQENLEAVCQALFSRAIFFNHARNIGMILSGPNAAAFRQFVHEQFLEDCRQECARYHFVAGAVRNQERLERQEDPLNEAVKGILDSQSRDEVLLNITCLGMMIWCSWIGDYRVSRCKLWLEPAVTERMLSYMRRADNLCYPIAAATMADLIKWGLVNKTRLDTDIFLASVGALALDDTERRGREILDLIPVRNRVFPDRMMDMVQTLRTRYLQKYEQIFGKMGQADELLRLTVLLCHLQTWDNEARKEQLERVCDYLCRDRVKPGDKLDRILTELVSLFGGMTPCWKTGSTDVEPEELAAPLTAEKRERIRELSVQLQDPKSAEREISDVRQALDIIWYLQPYESAVARNADPAAAALVRKLRLTVPNPGSYLVVSWFRMLCLFGCGSQALAFYRQHRPVLDLPDVVFLPLPQSLFRLRHGATERKPRRVEAGIAESVYQGHTQVLAAFLDSEYGGMVDCRDFVQNHIAVAVRGNREELAALYKGKYDDLLLIPEEEEELNDEIHELVRNVQRMIAEMKENSFQTGKPRRQDAFGDIIPAYRPTRYYDDLTVIRLNLAKKPESHQTILNMGYGDDPGMVLLAVGVRPESMKYASARLRADREFCMQALGLSGRVLPYVEADVLDDPAEVKRLLLAGECTLRDMPEPYCSDVEIVRHAVRRDVDQIRFATAGMRANREIAEEVLRQKQSTLLGPLGIFWLDSSLLDDKELMMLAVRTNPASFGYLSDRLKQDPDILALPHYDEKDRIVVLKPGNDPAE